MDRDRPADVNLDFLANASDSKDPQTASEGHHWQLSVSIFPIFHRTKFKELKDARKLVANVHSEPKIY